ncbi:MAG: stage V sporulation protein AC [Firmicutes bacterium HGW-Firmicutes-12]|nr:MAG: stage V sporulation protein AC [Firmicutes bacterium HGW-Firmicutes-12]
MKLRISIDKQQKAFQKIDSLEYKKKAGPLAPKPTTVRNVILAFFFGGLICTIGQLITNLFIANGLLDKDAGTATAAVLIFAGSFFTGLGVYDELGKYAGAGSIVPITGFANSIAASALEAKREGFIYGVGARLFMVAGPVIVYGTVVSILIGLIYFFMR